MQPAAKSFPELAAPDVNAGPGEIRVERRIELWLDGARMREPGCHSAPVRLHDLSPRGFRTEWPYLIDRGKRVWLKLPGFEAWLREEAKS